MLLFSLWDTPNTGFLAICLYDPNRDQSITCQTTELSRRSILIQKPSSGTHLSDPDQLRLTCTPLASLLQLTQSSPKGTSVYALPTHTRTEPSRSNRILRSFRGTKAQVVQVSFYSSLDWTRRSLIWYIPADARVPVQLCSPAGSSKLSLIRYIYDTKDPVISC